jgi:hypothetical protein
MNNQVVIPDSFLLTTQQAAEITGIKQSRIQNILPKASFVVRTSGGGTYGHMRIRFGDLDKLVRLDQSTRTVGKKNSDIEKLIADMAAIHKRIDDLEQFVDEFTAPVVS